MESAEFKSNRRVRHCYPLSEVYHRWVHDADNFIRYYHLEKEFGIMTEEEVDALYKQKKNK